MTCYLYVCKSEEHNEIGLVCKKTNRRCVGMLGSEREKCQQHCPCYKPYPEYKLKRMRSGRDDMAEKSINQIIKEVIK